MILWGPILHEVKGHLYVSLVARASEVRLLFSQLAAPSPALSPVVEWTKLQERMVEGQAEVDLALRDRGTRETDKLPCFKASAQPSSSDFSFPISDSFITPQFFRPRPWIWTVSAKVNCVMRLAHLQSPSWCMSFSFRKMS